MERQTGTRKRGRPRCADPGSRLSQSYPQGCHATSSSANTKHILSRTASAPLVHSCPTLLAPFFDSSCTLLRPSFDNSSTLLVLALAQFHPASKSRELRTSDTSYYINSKGEELHITDHPNVNNHALTALRRKGYRLLVIPPGDDHTEAWYWALKDERSFDAPDPIRLLGLVSVWEAFGDDWYDRPGIPVEDLMDRLWQRGDPEHAHDFGAMSDDEFDSMLNDYIAFSGRPQFPDVTVEPGMTRDELFEVVRQLQRWRSGKQRNE